MKPILKSVLLVACGAVLIGCGPLHVNKTVGLPGLPPVNTSKVTVVENWKDVTRKYQVVGKATIYRNAGGVPKGGAIKQMRAIAGEMGANGVIGLHGTTSFRSALMVRWLEPGETSQPVSVPFVVGLLPVKEGQKARGNQEKITEGFLGVLVIAIEPKGYYLLPDFVSGFAGGIEEAKSLDAGALQAIGGNDTHLLLEVGFANRSEVNLGVYNHATATIQGRLLDKKTAMTVYEGSGAGFGGGLFDVTGGFLASIFAPDDKRMQAVGQGVMEAFKNLQPISH